MRWPLLVLLPSVACGPSVAEEMERALRLSNDAIALGLLAAEGAAWIDATEPPTPTRGSFDATWDSEPGSARHAPAGDCPKIDREPDEGEPFTVTAAYTGCVSGSRLTPTVLQGALVITGTYDDADIDFSGLTVNTRIPTVGALRAQRRGSGRTYDIDGDVVFEGNDLLDALTGELHLSIDHNTETTVGIGGFALLDSKLGEARVDLDNVVIHLDDVAGECAVPMKGSALVDASPDIEVDFSGANDDGKVLVRRRSRESTPTRLCSFASDVL